MNKAEQEAGGWIKHDGKGCPDAYKDGQRVDIIIRRSSYIHLNRRASEFISAAGNVGGDLWRWVERESGVADIMYHRPHISEREQIDMAIEALEVCQRREYNSFELDNQSDLWKATEETLTKLKGRRP